MYMCTDICCDIVCPFIYYHDVIYLTSVPSGCIVCMVTMYFAFYFVDFFFFFAQ